MYSCTKERENFLPTEPDAIGTMIEHEDEAASTVVPEAIILPAVHDDHTLRGRVLLMLSALAFAVMGLATRLVPPQISSHEKVFYRSLIGTVLLLLWFAVTKPDLQRPRNWFGLLCRGVFGGLSLLCFFYSIDTVGLAKATLYCYTYPIFAAVFAWIDLKERPTTLVWIALLCATVGAAATVGNADLGAVITKGDIFGIIGGFMSGAAVTSIRKLTRTERSAWIVLSFTVVSTLLAWPMMGSGKATFAWSTTIPLFAVGVSAIAAQFLLTSGLRHIPAVEGGILSLATVPLSALLAIVFLHEPVGLRFWFGAALIILAGTIVTCRKPSRTTA